MAPTADDERSSHDETGSLRGLRRKLAKLNRRALAEREGPPPPRPSPTPREEGIVYRRDIPSVERRRVPAGGGICLPLEQCVEGREAGDGAGPPYYLIEQSVGQAGDGDGTSAALGQALDVLAERAEDVGFLDIETTGLGCSPVFLIGMLVFRDGAMVCRQFLARHYAEEASIVRRFARGMAEKPLLVTFNGKAFDVPYLRMRAAATGVALGEPGDHFDLLHESRRVFGRRLPDCKLKTLERYVCQRHRGDDIPGSDIPRAYHDFVRTGDAREIALIVKHNRWDLVTMVHLMSRLLAERRR
ncbi:MAG: ribonuclease H-like domain-containing protein [Candidatus Brocadiia bacterium]